MYFSYPISSNLSNKQILKYTSNTILLAEPLNRRQTFNRTISCNRNRSIDKRPIRDILHSVEIHRVHTSEDLRRRQSASIHLGLSADVLDNVVRSVEVLQQRVFQLVLRDLQLLLRDVIPQIPQRLQVSSAVDAHLHDDLHESRDVLLRALAVHAEQRRVLVAGVEAAHQLRQLVRRGPRAQSRGHIGARAEEPIPLAQDLLHQHERDGVLVRPAHGLEGHGDGGVRIGVVDLHSLRGGEPLRDGGHHGAVGRLAREVAEGAVGHFHELRVRRWGRSHVIVVQRTCSGDHHTRRGVVRLDVVDQVGTADALDVLLGTQNRVAKTAALVGRRVEEVEHHLVLVLEHVLHLEEDRVALAVYRCGIVVGVQKNVAQDVHGVADVFVETTGIVHGLLATRIAISYEQKWRIRI